MTWQPPERPDWVRAANEATHGPIADEAALPLERDALLRESAARQGLATDSAAAIDRAFGRAGFETEIAIAHLDRLLDALRTEAQLTPIGRLLTRRFLLRLLEVRSQLIRAVAEDPGLLEEEVERPLVVAGAPRTGTTILYGLLAADPRHRVPLGWELLRPVPSPTPSPAEDEDPRVALADRELVAAQTVASGLRSIHEYGSRKPKECLSAMSFAFQSEEFTARYSIPSFERWLVASDMTPAYEMHRLVLQVLQRRTSDTRWVLKSPVHLHSLPTLFATYPDARVAVTHRDPVTLLASLTSLIANLRWAHSDRVDVREIVDAHVARYRTTFDRLVEWTDGDVLPAPQMHHSQFADFGTDPLGTVGALYERFGLDLAPEAEEAMRRTLSADRTDAKGAHAYERALPGHALSELREGFAAYQTRFGVTSDI